MPNDLSPATPATPSLVFVSREEYEDLLVSRRQLTRLDDHRRDVEGLCDWEEGTIYFVASDERAAERPITA